MWQKPDATAAIACTAEYENAGAIMPDAHQLTGLDAEQPGVVERFGADGRDAVDVVHGEPGVGERGLRRLDHVLVGRETGVAPDLRVAETDDGDALSGRHHGRLRFGVPLIRALLRFVSIISSGRVGRTGA